MNRIWRHGSGLKGDFYMSMETCVWVPVTHVKCGQDGMCTSVWGGDRKISETPWPASLAMMTSFGFIEGSRF